MCHLSAVLAQRFSWAERTDARHPQIKLCPSVQVLHPQVNAQKCCGNKLPSYYRSVIDQQEHIRWAERRRKVAFVKSSEMVLIAMTWWFYTRQTLFHTAVGDIIRCYLREDQRERVTSCTDAIWSPEETWSCSLLQSALEREERQKDSRKGEGKREERRKGIKINFFFF